MEVQIFIYEFIFLNVLSRENVDLLLDSLRSLYGELWEVARVNFIGSNFQRWSLIFALNSLKVALYFLASYLEHSEDPKLKLARTITLMTINKVDELINSLSG